MIDTDDEIPPGHTRKPLRDSALSFRKYAVSWPELGAMVWTTAAVICVASSFAGLFVTPTDQGSLWMIVAIGSVALSVVAGDAERPAVSGFDMLKLIDLAVYGFKYALFSMLAAFPGLYIGVLLRDFLWGTA